MTFLIATTPSGKEWAGGGLRGVHKSGGVHGVLGRMLKAPENGKLCRFSALTHAPEVIRLEQPLVV